MEAGNPSGALIFDGWINRYLKAAGQATSPFQAVGLGQSLQLSLRGEVPALSISSIEAYDLITSEGEQDALRSAIMDIYNEQQLVECDRQLMCSIRLTSSRLPIRLSIPG